MTWKQPSSLAAQAFEQIQLPTWVVPAVPRRRVLWRRRARRVGLAVGGAVVIAAALVLVVGPSFFRYQTFAIHSGSMAPSIPAGSLVVATRADPEMLRTGDVVVFTDPEHGGTISRRIVAIEHDGTARVFETMADAGHDRDPWRLPAHEVRWQYGFGIPYVGHLVGPWTAPALLLLPAVFIAILGVAEVTRPRGLW